MEFLLLRPEMLTREILNILDILTETIKLPLSEARDIIKLQLDRNHYTYIGYKNGIPICVGSFIILSKLGRNGGRSAIIEDVVVSSFYQGYGYGKLLVEFLTKKASAYGIYKIFLNCSEQNTEFYVKCGFNRSGMQMKIEF